MESRTKQQRLIIPSVAHSMYFYGRNGIELTTSYFEGKDDEEMALHTDRIILN